MLVPLNRFHDLYGNTPLLSVEYYYNPQLYTMGFPELAEGGGGVVV